MFQYILEPQNKSNNWAAAVEITTIYLHNDCTLYTFSACKGATFQGRTQDPSRRFRADHQAAERLSNMVIIHGKLLSLSTNWSLLSVTHYKVQLATTSSCGVTKQWQVVHLWGCLVPGNHFARLRAQPAAIRVVEKPPTSGSDIPCFFFYGLKWGHGHLLHGHIRMLWSCTSAFQPTVVAWPLLNHCWGTLINHSEQQ